MNKESKRRIKWAESIATVYANHPGIKAIILGGSTARGVAHEKSDIDLGFFWSHVPHQEERSDLMGLNRVWAFTDNPDFKGLQGCSPR